MSVAGICDRLFAEQSITGERRLSIEVHNAIDSVAEAYHSNSTITEIRPARLFSPMRILPPRDVDVGKPSDTISDIERATLAWWDRYRPVADSDVVFDTTVFSAIGEEADLPVLRLRELFLPHTAVDWPSE
jgi:hypothetical protein